MYWERFTDLLSWVIDGALSWGKTVIDYPYTPYMIITLFLMIFITGYCEHRRGKSFYEYRVETQNTIGHSIVQGFVLGLLAIPLLIKELGLSLVYVVKKSWTVLNDSHIGHLTVLVVLVCTNFLTAMLVNFSEAIDPFLILFVIFVLLYGIGVYCHFKANNVLTDTTILRSGTHFVIGGVFVLFGKFIYAVSESCLENDIENRVRLAVNTNTQLLEYQYNIEIEQLKSTNFDEYKKSNHKYVELLEISNAHEETAQRYQGRYEKGEAKIQELKKELGETQRKLKNTNRRYAEEHANYEKLQAKMRAQFTDDDNGYRRDNLAPDDDGFIILGDDDDDWED